MWFWELRGPEIALMLAMKIMIRVFALSLVIAAILSPLSRAQADVQVRIYAASWCGFCKMLRAAMVTETGSNKSLRVDGVDLPVNWIEDNLGEEKKAGVRSYPTTFVTSEDGKIVEKVNGANLPGIKAAVQRVRAGVIEPKIRPESAKSKASKKSITDKKNEPAKKPAAKTPGAKTPKEKIQYVDWFTADDKLDYCYETDADGNVINETPVDPEVCEDAYAKRK